MIGRTLSHYRLVERLGAGGMGEVYRAEDTALGRDVALKILPSEVASDPERLERFRREARAVAALNHPNIVTIHSVEESEGIRFLTMELVEGKTLARLIPPGGLPLDRFLPIAIGCAEALAAAHGRGITHRDLKPANVMVNDEGRVKVLDFGLAKLREAEGKEGEPGDAPTDELTQDGRVLGTIPYMAPEQVQGKAVDQRSDVFSLGVVLYEMATGGRPFQGETSADLISSILRDQPEPVTEIKLDYPRELARIIRHCLEKDPQRRFQTALDLRNELEELAREVRSGDILPTSATQAVAARRPRPRWLVPAAAAAALVALLALGWLVVARRAPEAGPPVAAVASGGKPSVAVLYFDNLSGDANLDWLRHGLTDMLVTDLSQSQGVEVLSTDRLYQILKDMNRLDERITSFEVVREVADRAGVDTVLLGSFAKLGDAIRVSIKIQEAATGRIVRSDAVNVQGEENLFASVDDLTRGIRQGFELPAAASSDLERELEEVTTSSVAAYRFYSEGLRLHEQSKEEEAIALYRRALEEDPEFAMAHAKLAVSHSNRQQMPEAEEAARRALELSDRLPARERLYIEGFHYSLEAATWERSNAAYEKLLELYPDHEAARNNLALRLFFLERFEEAIVHLEELRRRKTAFAGSYDNLAGSYTALGRVTEAEAVLRDLLAERPDAFTSWITLAEILNYAGRPDDALQALEKAEELRPGFPPITAVRFEILVNRGEWEAARSQADRMAAMEHPFARLVGRYLRATHEIFAGRSAATLAQLDEAIRGYPHDDLFRASGRLFAAEVELERGRPREALDHARAARQGAQDDMPGWIALAPIALAEARLGRDDGAAAAAEELRARAEALPGKALQRAHHHLLGELALLRGDARAAVAELERAEALLYPQGGRFAPHPAIWYSLASAHLAAGDRDEAARWFERVAESGAMRLWAPVQAVRSLYFLGEIHEARGERAEAREYYRRFVEHWGDGDLDRERVAAARRKLAA